MTQKRVRATCLAAARKKAGGKRLVVTKVNYLAGTKKGRMKTFAVTTKKRI